ncbi:hypothetical protein D3C85_1184500 [compost metagenome]
MGIAQFNQLCEKPSCISNHLFNTTSEIKFQIHENLIITRTSAMDLFTGISNTLCQQPFHLGVHIFYRILNCEFTRFNICIDIFKFFLDIYQLFSGQQSDTFQHFNMGQRA